jgi:hypothetical protein
LWQNTRTHKELIDFEQTELERLLRKEHQKHMGHKRYIAFGNGKGSVDLESERRNLEGEKQRERTDPKWRSQWRVSQGEPTVFCLLERTNQSK